MKNKGFTLIEVLIAVTIMATLGLLAAQTIRQAINQKKNIQEIVNDTSRLRDGVKIMERDINLAYHHRDWEKEILEIAKKKKKTSPTTPGNQLQTPVFDANGNLISVESNDPNVEAARKDPTTHFVGKENEIHFVTMNTGRLLKDAPQADSIEVGYALKDCRSFDSKTNSKCVFRRLSPWVDEDVTKGGDEFVLVENITEFNLRYLGRGKQDWTKDWRTDGGGDGATKGNFPWMVELSITYQKPSEKNDSKKHSMQLVIPIHFPNNKEENEGTDSTAAPNATPNSQTPAPGPTL